MRNNSKQVAVENPPPFPDKDGATKHYFVAFIKPLADKFVLLGVIAVLGIVCALEAAALFQLIPLKKSVPYFLEVERDADGKPTGRVSKSDKVATEFEVAEANKRYFLNQWLILVMSMDRKLTIKTWLPKATTWTRGKATNQLSEWVDKAEKIAERMERDPLLTREMVTNNISFISPTIAIARLTLIEKHQGVETKRTRKVVTLEHALVPVDEEQEYENPIGLTITGFVVNDELEKQ